MYQTPMFICAFMTYRLHVCHLFDEMSVMVRLGYINSLINFFVIGFVLVSVIVLKVSLSFCSDLESSLGKVAWVL